MIEVKNVVKTFDGFAALNDATLSVPTGAVYGLVGPNGAGKTTAFNVITGVYQPTNGAVWFEGRKIIENTPHGKMKKLYKGQNASKYSHIIAPTPDKITQMGIARTFQNIRLWKSQTVFENVLIAKHMRARQNVFSAAFRLNRAEEKRMREEAMSLLEEQNLAHLKDEVAGSLPYGAQRRLEIVRALATNPSLLLLDEPAAGMNPSETAELMENIRRIRDTFQIAILLIEHDMNLVMGICEGICVLNFGRIIAKGTPDEIRNNPQVIEAYLGKKEG